MDELLKTVLTKALTQVPDLVVLSAVVVMGLRHLSKRDAQFETFLREVHEQHLDARQQSKEAIQDNTAVTKELSRTITDLRVAVGRVGLRTRGEE